MRLPSPTFAIELDENQVEIGRKAYKSMYAAKKANNVALKTVKACCEGNRDNLVRLRNGRIVRFVYAGDAYNGEVKKRKPVFAIEIDKDLNEISRTYYDSTFAAGRDLNIYNMVIKYCCEGKNRVKSGYSKNDGRRYKFIYADPATE